MFIDLCKTAIDAFNSAESKSESEAQKKYRLVELCLNIKNKVSD